MCDGNAGAILQLMTNRVGDGGEVVIPDHLRDELGIEQGDEVRVWRHGDHVAVGPVRTTPELRGRYRGSELARALEAERIERGRRKG